MKKFLLTIAYDGSRYLGWQKTKMGPSIEETITNTLEQILQENVSLTVASRTDAGVHATGQIATFTTEKNFPHDKLHHSVNSLLPNDISLVSLDEVALPFHPTLDNRGKEYRYLLCSSKRQAPFLQNYSWYPPSPLSIEKMRQAASALIGEHDFSAFCNAHKDLPDNRIRELYSITITPEEEEKIWISIHGKDFLYKMVRNIVGTLVYIGTDKLPLESIKTILEQKDRTLAGVTAPASGLYLHQVFFDHNSVKSPNLLHSTQANV